MDPELAAQQQALKRLLLNLLSVYDQSGLVNEYTQLGCHTAAVAAAASAYFADLAVSEGLCQRLIARCDTLAAELDTIGDADAAIAIGLALSSVVTDRILDEHTEMGSRLRGGYATRAGSLSLAADPAARAAVDRDRRLVGGASPAAGDTLAWIVHCGKLIPDEFDHQLERITLGVSTGELDPDFALAFYIDQAGLEPEQLELVIDPLTDAIMTKRALALERASVRESERRSRLPPVIV
jgi:hypothetical protein